MELIRISDHKLKIMLTPLDMCHFDLNTETFGEDSEKLHGAFRLLLEEIRKQTDFEGDDNHLSVQYFPSREGGCEMFISHLRHEDGTSKKASQRPSLLPAAKSAAQACPAPKQSNSFKKDTAYRFEQLIHLLAVCKRLCGMEGICESTAYRDEKGCYFLFLTLLSGSPFSTPEEFDFIAEYGRSENAALLRLYIREHASPLCPSNAVGELARLA